MIIKLHHKPRPKYAPAILLSHAKKILLILIAFIGISYFFFDTPVAIYFHDHPSFLTKMAEGFSDLFNPPTLMVALPILYFLNKVLWKQEKLSEPLRLLVFALPFSFLMVKIFKYLLARDRPKRLFSEGLYGFHFMGQANPEFSFPSGHACLLGATVGALACFMPKYTWHLFSLGILLSFCRVLEGDHYVSDVVAGVVLGALLSQLLYIVIKKQKFHF